MARRKRRASSYTRKLSKAGSFSYAVILPKKEVESLGGRERQKLTVKRESRGFSVRDWKRR